MRNIKILKVLKTRIRLEGEVEIINQEIPEKIIWYKVKISIPIRFLNDLKTLAQTSC